MEENNTMHEENAVQTVSKDAKMWGMLAHLTSFAFFIFPFGNILGPLIIWLIKKDEYPFVDDQGKESLNFQISMTIYGLIAGVLVLILVGVALLVVVFIVDFILVIVASIKANDGEHYRYPLTIRLIN